MMRSLPTQPRRGMTTIVAIALLGLTASSLVLMVELTQDEARYTGEERVAAQLRQLLLAGEINRSSSTLQGETALAVPLDEATLVFRSTGTTGSRRFDITATLQGESMSQELVEQPTSAGKMRVASTLSPMIRRP